VTGAVDAGTTLRVRPLAVTAQGEDFLVGDRTRNSFVVLPAIGVHVIELLRTGRRVGEVAIEAARHAGTDVDVVDFARTLCELGFAEVAAGPASDQDSAHGDRNPRRTRWAPLVVGPPAWTGAGLAALGCVLAFAAAPTLLPTVDDIFFLDSPARSMAALVLLTFALRAAHEVCHWATARAEGVSARVSIGRRLYLLVFETDLTGLWSLPRHRRYWPLLSGLAFDAVVLAVVLAGRLSASAGWWTPAPPVAGLLAALTFLQVAGIVAQFFLFIRTDVYAVFATAAGCFNLWRVTGLVLRRRLGLASAAHQAELAAAHPRDRAVARWYVWVYAAGLLVAGWFFVVYFVPATLRLVRWIVTMVAAADPRHLGFWEAAGFGTLILLPYLLTLWVFVRDRLRPGRAVADRRRGATAGT
jgi:hypothetical protein